MRYVALIRGINVGATRKLPMAELREECSRIGWDGVTTYIQSGNVIFSSDAAPATLEAELEQAIERRFGLAVPVIVRSSRQWLTYAPVNPFPEAAAAEPNRLMMMLSKRPPVPGTEQALRGRAGSGERVAQAGDAVWIHYPDGMGATRLSPSLIDRLIGSPATARNWRTVLKIGEMLAA